MQRLHQNHERKLTQINKKFYKRDEGFICENCGESVPALLTSSRDHCTKCLCSIHIDVNPGDRANTCKGRLAPIGIEINNKKGIVIKYKCDTCGELHNCKAASDDNYETILNISSNPITL